MPTAVFAGTVALHFVDPAIAWPAPPVTPGSNLAAGPYGPPGPDLRPYTCPLINGPVFPACYQDYTVSIGVSYTDGYYYGVVSGGLGSFVFGGWKPLGYTTAGTTLHFQCLSLWNGSPVQLDAGPENYPLLNTTPYLGAQSDGIASYPGDANYPPMTIDSLNVAAGGPYGSNYIFDNSVLNSLWAGAIAALYVGSPHLTAPILTTAGGFVLALGGAHYFVEANWRRYWSLGVPAGIWPTISYDPKNGWWYANGAYSQFSSQWVASNPPLLLASPLDPLNTPTNYGPTIGPPPGVFNGSGFFPYFQNPSQSRVPGPQLRAIGNASLGRCCYLTSSGIVAQAKYPTATGTR